MSTYQDWDGRQFTILGSSKGLTALSKLSTRLCVLCWPGAKPYDHLDDVKIISNSDSQIAVLASAWQALDNNKQECIQNFVDGYLSGASDIEDD